MSPTPLKAFQLPIHLGSIAVDDSRIAFTEQTANGLTGSTGKDGKHGKQPSHDRPQPGFLVCFLRRRFIHMHLVLFGQSFLQFLVGSLQGGRYLVLHLHRKRWAARLAKQVLQEQRRATFALPEVGHQQSGEGDEPRTRLPRRYSLRKRCTRTLAAAGTDEPVLLIFGDDRLDLGQFPHLMPKWFRISPCQLRGTASTSCWFQGHDVLALLRGYQLALMSRMAKLTTSLLLRILAFRPWRLSMRMLATGWQRGVLRVQAEPGFQLLDPVDQRLHESANHRSHFRFDFRRNRNPLWFRGRHTPCRRQKHRSCPDQFLPVRASASVSGRDRIGDQVTFSYKDYAGEGCPAKEMQVSAEQLLELFLQHVSPKGFKRIRYVGFWSGPQASQRIAAIREQLTRDPACQEPDDPSPNEDARCPVAADSTEQNISAEEEPALCASTVPTCPHCGSIDLQPFEVRNRDECRRMWVNQWDVFPSWPSTTEDTS